MEGRGRFASGHRGGDDPDSSVEQSPGVDGSEGGCADGLRSASEPLGNLQREASPRAGRAGGRVNREHVTAQAITALN
jgi:hypothetical protein